LSRRLTSVPRTSARARESRVYGGIQRARRIRQGFLSCPWSRLPGSLLPVPGSVICVSPCLLSSSRCSAPGGQPDGQQIT
jgi:hypothetical protein